MSKRIDRTRLHTKTPKVSGTAMLIFKGVLVSFSFSIACVVLLAVISLVSENTYVDDYIQYIMVGVTMLSIFVGSACCSSRCGKRNDYWYTNWGYLCSIFYWDWYGN